MDGLGLFETILFVGAAVIAAIIYGVRDLWRWCVRKVKGLFGR